MKTIADLKNISGFYDKPWLVLGTGPGLSKLFELDPAVNIHNYNIWAINHAVLFVKHVTIASLADYEAVHEITPHPFSCEAMLTRAKNFNVPAYYYSRIHYFNYEGDSCTLPGVTYLPCSSSSSLAFMVLGMLGIKEIYSLGLDGGKGDKHPFFDFFDSVRRYAPIKIDYTQHNEGCYHWCREYDIKWGKL